MDMVHDERPPPKPNPSSSEIWVNSVIDEIIDANDDTMKPLIATLVSEDYIKTQNILQHMRNEIDAPRVVITQSAENQFCVDDFLPTENEDIFDNDTPVLNALMNHQD